MDYLYFFVMLALQKLKETGKMGFITTSYWLTADGAGNLRKYILDNARIVEIIDFGEIKLFEHAKGQHNIVFVLEKCKDKEKKEQNKIKLVKVKEHFDGKNVDERLTKLVDYIKKHIYDGDYSDQYIEVFYSAVKQGELTEEPWYIFYRENEAKILNQIERVGEDLIKFCDVNQGLISGCHKVGLKNIKLLAQKTINEYDINVGDGIFVMSGIEANSLSPSSKEMELIKPFYKNSNIHSYCTDVECPEFVIYSTSKTDMDEFPKIKEHLLKYKSILLNRLDTFEENYPWHKLHRERDKEIFENETVNHEKIICPYRSTRNIFGYAKKPFYGSTDMYFITPKRGETNNTNFTNDETLKKHDLRYILGVLNSSLFRVWCHHKTKPKGKVRELFYTPLTKMPIKPIDFGDSAEMEMYKSIIDRVQTIVDLKKELSAYPEYFQGPILELEVSETLPTILTEKIIGALYESEKRNLWTSSQLKPIYADDSFVLRRTNEVIINIDQSETDFEYTLVLVGKSKRTIKIDGEKEILNFLKNILDENYRGRSWGEIEEKIILPDTMQSFERKYVEIRDKVHEILEKIQKFQDEIDDMVCNLYGIEKDDVNDTIEQLF